MAEHSVQFVLNGSPVSVENPHDEPLLFALRNRLGLKAAHFGCGLEQCGACVVDVDGVARFSCQLPLSAVAGLAVTTAEALAGDPVGAAILAAFEAEQAGQCGYCLAGIAMSAFALLRKEPTPDRARIVEALDRHLCRCGAHPRILRAVENAAAALKRANA